VPRLAAERDGTSSHRATSSLTGRWAREQGASGSTPERFWQERPISLSPVLARPLSRPSDDLSSPEFPKTVRPLSVPHRPSGVIRGNALDRQKIDRERVHDHLHGVVGDYKAQALLMDTRHWILANASTLRGLQANVAVHVGAPYKNIVCIFFKHWLRIYTFIFVLQ